MCSADGDCPHGTCTTTTMSAFGMSTTYPGGYCTGRCLEAADCGQGGVCTPGFAGGTGGCYRGCSSDSDCDREGYRCRTVAMGVMGCSPGSPPLGDDVAGKTCSADGDCGAGKCAMTLTSGTGFIGRMLAAPGGYCTGSCVDNSDCGAGAACIGG